MNNILRLHWAQICINLKLEKHHMVFIIFFLADWVVHDFTKCKFTDDLICMGKS